MNFTVIKQICVPFLLVNQFVSTCIAYDTLKQALNYLQRQNKRNFDSLVVVADMLVSTSGNDTFKEILFQLPFEKSPYYQVFIFNERNVSKMIEKVEILSNFFVSSLVIILDFNHSDFMKNVVFSISKEQLQMSSMLIINPYNLMNSTDEINFVKALQESMREQIVFDTQLYILSGTKYLANLHEAYKTCDDGNLDYELIQKLRHDDPPCDKSDSLWIRRNNLRKCNLRVAYIDQPPYITKKNDTPKITHTAQFGNETFYGGNINQLELIEMLSYDLNFTTTWIPTKDNSYGVYNNKTKEWNGLIGLISSDEADFSNALLTVTSLRSQAIAFTADIGMRKFGLYMAKPSVSPSWSTFIDVCDSSYWCSLIGGIMIFSLVLALFSQVLRRKNASKFRLEQVLSNFLPSLSVVLLSMGACDVFTKNISSLCQSNAFKVLLFTVCLLGLLNKEAYTGGLISSLVSKQFESDINSLEDFLKHPNYQLILRNGTASVHYFSEAKVSPHKEIWENLLFNNSIAYVNEPGDAEKRIMENSKEVYFDIASQIEHMFENYPCNITRPDKTYFERSFALGMSKNSPYLKLFNHKINQYKEHGVLAKMGAFTKVRKEDIKCPSEHIESIGYDTIFSAFVVLGVGLICSLLYILAELTFSFPKYVTTTIEL